MERRMPVWLVPSIAVAVYPVVILAFGAVIDRYHESAGGLMAGAALLTMLLAMAIPLLAGRALLSMRHDEGPVLTRGLLYLMVAAPSLFTLFSTVSRMASVPRPVSIGIWVCAWLAIGVVLYLRNGRSLPSAQHTQVTRLRIVHGVTALCLLCVFLLPHLANHGLAAWSVELHKDAMAWLRLWYRSDWVEPVLLALLAVMIGTGVPMVGHYSRQRMDAFRVVQAATGVYVGVFLCSHVVATLYARRLGIETDWSFAAEPTLLTSAGMLSRLIPHYVFGTFFFLVHVACGLRIVLLQHGVASVLANRALYGLTSAGGLVTVTIAAALLGFHWVLSG